MEYTLAQIKEKITTNPQWTERAILALYRLQTSEEQHNQQTVENNKRGFNGVDAPILSSFASWMRGGTRHLTAKQLTIAQKRIGKYAAQLYGIANANECHTVKYSFSQFTCNGITAVAEASDIQFAPVQHIEIDNITYEFEDYDRNNDNEITAWNYTARGRQAKYLVVRILND